MGHATAIGLFTRSARLPLADYRKDTLTKTQKEIEFSFKSTSQNPTMLATAVDIRESSQVGSWIEKTVSHFGRLDGAANIVRVLGKIFLVHDLIQLSNEEWEFVTKADFKGLLYCMRAQLRVLITLQFSHGLAEGHSIGWACVPKSADSDTGAEAFSIRRWW